MAKHIATLIACEMLLSVVPAGCGKSSEPATFHNKSAPEWGDNEGRLSALRLLSSVLGEKRHLLKPERPFVIGRLQAMALAEPSALVRQQIAHSLGEIKWPPEAVLEALVPMLADKDASVRKEAATGISAVAQLNYCRLQVAVDDIRGLVETDGGDDIAVILLAPRPEREVVAMMEQAGFDRRTAQTAYHRQKARRRSADFQSAPMVTPSKASELATELGVDQTLGRKPVAK